MSWFKNPWLADKGSNPWAESNPWAQGKPEFQKAIGQSPKTDVIPINDKKNIEDVRTGYWLENNTIVFSTYVYNATSYSDRAVQALMEKAVNLQKSFGNGTYSFDFRPNWVSKPRYDYSGTYRNYRGANPKITKFIPKDRQSVNKEELLWITEDKNLPAEYYMELFDYNRYSPQDGGAHSNSRNKLQSCYFGLYMKQDDAHTIVHESLHPVLYHPFAKGDDTNLLDINPLYPIYIGFVEEIKNLIQDKTDEGKNLSTRISEIESYIRGNEELRKKAETIRNNIMTTAAITNKSDVGDVYAALAFYLYSYLPVSYPFDRTFTSGNKLAEIQIDYLIDKLG